MLKSEKLYNRSNEERGLRVFNIDTALTRMCDDVDSLKLVLQTFLRSYTDLLSELKGAIGNKDGESLRRATHTLKGAFSTLAADATVPIAIELEETGIRQDFPAAIDAYARLEQEVKRFIEAITIYIGGGES